jgi:hypothetical protein
VPDIDEIRALFASLVDCDGVTPLGTSLDVCVEFTHSCLLSGLVDPARWRELVEHVANLRKYSH